MFSQNQKSMVLIISVYFHIFPYIHIAYILPVVPFGGNRGVCSCVIIVPFSVFLVPSEASRIRMMHNGGRGIGGETGIFISEVTYTIYIY